jgi:dUTP pyrophosphatase
MTARGARTGRDVGDSGEATRAGSIRLAVRRLDADLPLPRYAREGDAGLDLYAAESVTLAPGARVGVRTGIALAIPEGFAGFVLPRSGLALRSGLTILNAPGLVDAGYRGELQVLLVNHGGGAVTVQRGDRVAQLVVQRVEHARLVEVDTLPASERGPGGFGSTGA